MLAEGQSLAGGSPSGRQKRMMFGVVGATSLRYLLQSYSRNRADLIETHVKPGLIEGNFDKFDGYQS